MRNLPFKPFSPRAKSAPLLLAAMALSLAGCSGLGSLGGGQSLIAIQPTAPESIDSGQSLAITASVVNDNGSGATFTSSGGGSFSNNVDTYLGDSRFQTETFNAPTVTAKTVVTITVASVNTPSQTASVQITVNPALAIASATLPNGTTGTAYSAAIATTGGTAPIAYSLVSGALPGGVSLNTTTGALTGTPTSYGAFTFTIGATDSSAAGPETATQTDTVNVLPTIATQTLPNGVVGTAYSQQLALNGTGSGAVTWSVVSGSLPTGLGLSATGAITGTPALSTAGNSYPFTVQVTIGSAASAPVALSIAIYALPAVTTTTLPSGNIGVRYSQHLTYSGGSGAAPSWAIVAGSLPAASGLTLNAATGVLSGTPTTATTYSFSVAVTVGTQTSAAQALTLTVNSLLVTSAATATGEVGLQFGFQLTAAGGTSPYTWAISAGGNPLPPGLALNSATGFIAGTPTTNAASPYTGVVVQATDHVGATATQAMTFTINPARGAANDALLSGQYAFLLSGFDSTGHPLAMAGKVTADGSGNLVSGVVDVNGTGLSAPTLNSALTATTYTVGADNRGKLTLAYAGTTLTFVFSLDSVTGGVAGAGYMTEFDASGQSLTGPLALQTPAAFTTPAITGGYAFGLEGFAANSTAATVARRAVIGETQFNGTNTAASSELLSTGAGSATPIVPTSTSINIAGNGRGTIVSNLPNGGGTVSLVAYVVSSAKLFVLSSSAASGTTASDLLSGQLLQQTISTGSFTSASLNATSVLRAERLTLNSASVLVPDAQIGLLTFTGAGRLTLASDEDNGGIASSNPLGGSYTVAANGRVSLTLTAGIGGCYDCVNPQTYAYLVGANQGFLMDFAASPNFGYFTSQTATGIGNPTLFGGYSAGTLSPLAQSGTFVSASLSANGGGVIAGTADLNAAGTLSPDTAVSLGYTLSATGRATIPTTGSGQVLYVVTPTQSLLLDLTAARPVVVEITKQ